MAVSFEALDAHDSSPVVHIAESNGNVMGKIYHFYVIPVTDGQQGTLIELKASFRGKTKYDVIGQCLTYLETRAKN